LISSAFLYPNGLAGTDFFEEVDFEIQSNGKVALKEIIPFNVSEEGE